MTFLQFECVFEYEQGFALDWGFRAEKQITAIVGPSGCGKTTVLNLICGLLKPSRGTITLGNRVLFDSAKGIDVWPEHRKIGYVFQDYLLFPHMTVEKNLRYGHDSKTVGRLSLTTVVEKLGLGDLLHRYPRSLSGGQKQRVALGRAILTTPELLLLDEPLSAVDAAHRSSVCEYLSEIIAEFAIPTILVSHDHGSIESMTDNVISMENQASPLLGQ